MVETVPTGRTPHEIREVPPDVLDCGHRFGPGLVTIGFDLHPAGGRARTYYCRACRHVTYAELDNLTQ